MLGTGEWLMIGCILFLAFSASQMGIVGNAVGRFVLSLRRSDSRASDPGSPD